MNSQVVYVLLVEDDLDYGALLRRRLMGKLTGEGGPTFVVAQTGLLQEAITYVIKNGVDVIVLDLNLPDATGLETLVRLREAAPDAASIVLTGRDDQFLATQALNLGAQDYLVKGNFNTELLVRAVRYAFERKQSERALTLAEERLRQVATQAPEGTKRDEIASDFGSLLERMATQNSLALSQLGSDNPARVHVEKLNQTITLAADLTRRLISRFDRRA